MNIDLYSGARGVFEFLVDDITTAEIDDFSDVTWVLRILGETSHIEVLGSYVYPNARVSVSSAVSETIEPGHYRWYLIAQRIGEDEIVAGDGILTVKAYPVDQGVS